MKALIIDDSKFSIMTTQKAMSDHDIEMESTTSGKQGKEMFTWLSPDLVITDLVMPDLRGEEVVKFIRSKSQTCFIAVVSANIQSRVQETVLELGANIFIPKPITKQKMDDLMEQFKKFRQS